MKYILGIGLSFKYFRGTTVIKIFSDDTLIDELPLDQPLTSERRDAIYMTDHLDTNSSVKKNNFIKYKKKKFLLSNKMFCYEIDESILGRKISFEFEDNNSNYTNGFMTRSNLVSFPSILLLPKFDFESTEKTQKFWRFIHRRFIREYPIHDGRHMADVYGKVVAHQYWPAASHLYDDKDQSFDMDQWFGGTQKIHVMLRKKFGVHHIYDKSIYKTKIPLVLGDTTHFITYNHYYNLLNIYDEDQRSNRTKN
tara:strand:+ start:614 stop:1369 length:756 start_codon:yes stop_codon:yes gene_type:complete